MKNIIKFALSFAASIALLGCSEGEDESGAYPVGEGSVSIELSSRAVESSGAVLKIYSVAEGTGGEEQLTLIRRYSPITDMPEALSFVKGRYRATVSLASNVMATFSVDELSNYGEADFEIVAGESKSLIIDCKLVNTVVKVDFDSTLADNLEEGYKLTVMAADSYDELLVGVETVPQLVYTESGVGYYILPRGVSNLAWKFSGVKRSVVSGVEGELVEKMGVITAPKSAEQTTLKFSYPKYLEVAQSLSIYVDDSVDSKDDMFNFEPQPMFSGEALEQLNVIANDASYEIGVKSLASIGKVSVKLGDTTLTPFDLFDNAVNVGADEMSFVLDEGSTASGKLVINRPAFNHLNFGGDYKVEISAWNNDEKRAEGRAKMDCRYFGITNSVAVDLWKNSAVLSVFAPEQGDVSIEYRKVGDTDWVACGNVTAVAGESDHNYTANISAEWSTAYKNEKNNPYYKFVSGIRPNTGYECRVTAAGSEYITKFTTQNAGNQLYDNHFSNSSLSCYTQNSTNSAYWASGNNDKTGGGSLCTFGKSGSNSFVKMEGSVVEVNIVVSTIKKLASGNLFYGKFNMGSTDGTASLGQKFTWNARPIKLKFKYTTNVDKVDYVEKTGYLNKGDIDPCRVYVAVVNWAKQRNVVSGLKFEGAWDPIANMSLSEGQIIGYASVEFLKSTANMNDFVEAELDFNYYDINAKPASNNYSIVVSCSTSKYGDFLVGSTKNKLYLDDLELVY